MSCFGLSTRVLAQNYLGVQQMPKRQFSSPRMQCILCGLLQGVFVHLNAISKSQAVSHFPQSTIEGQKKREIAILPHLEQV